MAASLRRALARVSMLALAACSTRSAADAPDGATPPADAAADAPDRCAPFAIDGSALDDSGCSYFVQLPCGMPPDASVSQCAPDIDTCQYTCGPNLLLRCIVPGVSCDVEAGLLPDAALLIECSTCVGDFGRRPRGLVAERFARAGRELGAYFAAMAHLEAASVPAFRELGRALARHGAPARLVALAARAEQDERRHARAATRLAKRFGGKPRRPRVAARTDEGLADFLASNVEEGCVGETFAALVASWQADHAKDARVARTMRSIAADETRHAALAWKILAWGAPRLDAAGRRRLRHTFEVALHRRAGAAVSAEVTRVTGHPDARAARALARGFAALVRAEIQLPEGSRTTELSSRPSPSISSATTSPGRSH